MKIEYTYTLKIHNTQFNNYNEIFEEDEAESLNEAKRKTTRAIRQWMRENPTYKSTGFPTTWDDFKGEDWEGGYYQIIDDYGIQRYGCKYTKQIYGKSITLTITDPDTELTW